jgi:hypothetical protein
VRPTIKVAGVDITPDVQFSTAKFTSMASGAVGLCDLYVRDRGHDQGPFVTGGELTCDWGEDRLWGGYLRKVSREFPLPVLPTPDHARKTPRYFHLEGGDYNTLLQQRIIYNKANPKLGNTSVPVEFVYNPSTYDDTIILDIVGKYTDLLADGVSLAGVQRVGVTVYDIPGITSGKGLRRDAWPEIAVAGYKVDQMLATIARNTGAIYYLDPRKVLDYVDVDTANSPYTLTDQPSGEFDVGYRELEILFDGVKLDNDAFVWGTTLGSSGVVTSRVQDATSIALHGRWQTGLNTAALYRQASVDAVAHSYVYGTLTSHRGAKDDRVAFSATVFNTPLIVAQKLRCVSAVEEFDDIYPIRRIEMTFPTPNDIKMVVALSWEPDIPWTFSEFQTLPIPVIRIPPPGGFSFPTEDWLYIDTFDVRTLCSDVSFGLADNNRHETRPWVPPFGS